MPVMPRFQGDERAVDAVRRRADAEGTWARPRVPRLVFADSSFPPGGATSSTGGAIGTGPAGAAHLLGRVSWVGAEGQTRQQMIIDRTQRLIDSPHFSGWRSTASSPPSFRRALTVTSPDAPASFPANSMAPALGLVETLIDASASRPRRRAPRLPAVHAQGVHQQRSKRPQRRRHVRLPVRHRRLLGELDALLRPDPAGRRSGPRGDDADDLAPRSSCSPTLDRPPVGTSGAMPSRASWPTVPSAATPQPDGYGSGGPAARSSTA